MKERVRAWLAHALLIASFPLAMAIPSNPANAVSSNPTPDCSAGSTCTVTFTYTGDYYAWNAPLSGSVTINVWGAKGGDITSHYPINGGLGGYASGDLQVTSGQTLYVYVGASVGFSQRSSN